MDNRSFEVPVTRRYSGICSGKESTLVVIFVVIIVDGSFGKELSVAAEPQRHRQRPVKVLETTSNKSQLGKSSRSNETHTSMPTPSKYFHKTAQLELDCESQWKNSAGAQYAQL
jgi:hypothetical protein